MKNRVLFALAFAMVTLLSMTADVSGEVIVDQEQWTSTASIDLTIEPPQGHKTLDQSVTAGVTGLLRKVEFSAEVTSDRVYFYVNQPGRGGPPLESMTFATRLQQGSGQYSIDVSSAKIFLQAGDVFSIGLVGMEGTTPAGSFRAARDMNPDAYPRGALYWRYGGTGWLGLGYDDDMMFRTYVDIGPTNQELFIPAAASAHGQQGTFWTTGAWLYNGSDDLADVYGAFLRQGRDNSAAVAAPMFLATIPAHGTVALEDLVSELGSSDATGGLYLLGELDQIDAPLPFLYVTSQTSTPNPAGQGSYGQGILAVPGDTATQAVAAGACQSAEKRTNVGVLNTSSSPVTLSITVFDANGSVAVTTMWNLAPYEQRQVGLPSFGISSLSGGTVVFARTSAGGSYCGYLSIIDQDSGDAVYVAAR